MELLPPVLIDQVIVRVPGSPPDGLEAQLTQLLAGADLSPANLRPGSILLVKRLALSDPVHAPDWAVTARRDLADLVGRAVSPADGVIPVGAEAVLFRDWSELLACLALDLAGARAQERWWWRAILKRLPRWRGAPVGAALICDPRVTPLVLSRLRAWGAVDRVLRLLPPAEIEQILAVVLRTWGAPALAVALPRSRMIARDRPPALSSVGRAPRSESQAPSAGRPSPLALKRGEQPSTEAEPMPDAESVAEEQEGELTALTPPLAPWHAHLQPAEVTRFTPAEEALIGTALALVRSPSQVRSLAFGLALRDWAEAGAPLPVPGRATPVAPARSPGRPSRQDARPAVNSEATRSRPSSRPEPPAFVQSAPAAGDAPSPATAPTGSEKPVSAVIAPDAPAQSEVAPIPPLESSAPHAESQDALAMGEAAASPGPPLTGTVKTQYGGLLYLVNLFQYLDLPDRFEPDHALASQLSTWGLLWAVGLSLLGEATRPDPLWALFLELDGSEPGALLGEGISPAPVETPAAWGAASSGFADPATIPGPFHPDLRRFLTGLMPGLTARLQSALPPDRSIHELLLAPAELHLNGPHLDLIFPLEAISIPARMAGLDRNPGWVAPFGRIITFHYL